jgi:hypothetical protein
MFRSEKSAASVYLNPDRVILLISLPLWASVEGTSGDQPRPGALRPTYFLSEEDHCSKSNPQCLKTAEFSRSTFNYHGFYQYFSLHTA